MSNNRNRNRDLPTCPVTGEIKPHRDVMGVATYRVRVITVADFDTRTKGKN